MSLQLAAQHLSSHGRGKDSTLVHMSPREVKSLNDLAMAHGGHLTINPNTGLPEAGFLEMILPVAIGALAGPGGMALGAETALGSAGTAALIGGGLTYAMTGSLQKGLMAGLGAYGGANLGGALGETAVTMDPSVVQAQNAAIENAKNLYDPTGTLSPEEWASTHQTTSNELAKNLTNARGTVTPAPGDFMGGIKNMFKGAGSLGQEGGLSSLYQNLGGSPMSLLKSVGSAAAPAIGEMMTPKKKEEAAAGDADMGQRYGFAMNPTGGQPQQAQSGQNPPGTPQTTTPFPTPDLYGKEQRYFAPSYTKLTPEAAKSLYGYAGGGSIEAMSNANAIGANTGYPMANIQPGAYATPYQQPVSRNVISDDSDTGVNPMTGEMRYADGGIAEEDRPTETPAVKMFQQMQGQRAAQAQAPAMDINAMYQNYAQQAIGTPNQLQAPTAPPPTTSTLGDYGYAFDPIKQQYAQIKGAAPEAEANNPFSIENRPVVGYTSTGDKIYGEQSSNSPFGRGFGRAAGGSISSHLGDYSDGGRLLRGPGDGVSDSIPAMIGKKQPARLADGEFVVPARIVSELGNGSTEAGARKLYAMMDRIQSARGKTVGKGKVAKNSRSEKYLPA